MMSIEWRTRDKKETEREQLDRLSLISREWLHVAALHGDLGRLSPVAENLDDPKCVAALATRIITYVYCRIREEAERSGLLYVDLLPITKMLWREYGETLRRHGFTERDLVEHVYVKVCLEPEEAYMFDWLLSILRESIGSREVKVIIDELRNSMVDIHCFRSMNLSRILRLLQQLLTHVRDWAVREVSSGD